MLEIVRERWAQLVGAVLGLWLMAAPAVLGYGDPASTLHHVVGPITAAVGIVALQGHLRPLRWLHPPLGAILIVVPPLVGVLGGDLVALANGVLVGLALIGLGAARGRVAGRYGGGWAALWTGNVFPGASGTHSDLSGDRFRNPDDRDQ